MMQHARVRRAFRPHGTASVRCQSCYFFHICGGIEPEPLLFEEDCFDWRCCGKGGCDNVCPYNADFAARCRAVGGPQFNDISPMTQKSLDLPRYVPVIHHGYKRDTWLAWPVVALDTYQVFRLINAGRYGAVAESGPALRKVFGLAPSTKIILRGVAPDAPLERYWAYRRRDNAPAQMAKLDISLAIGPNFSHFLDVPRTDNLFNRKRQLICLAEFHTAEVNPAPHLNAIVPSDWRFWRQYLHDNPTIRHIAVEFQTGNKERLQGRKTIDWLMWLREALGRDLHLLAIGAAQYVEILSEQFESFTLIDSAPFMKAIKRRKFDLGAGTQPWTEALTQQNEGVESIIQHNIAEYATWIRRRCEATRQRKEAMP